jgi:serine/threonine-protein kinase TTK/MPS1
MMATLASPTPLPILGSSRWPSSTSGIDVPERRPSKRSLLTRTTSGPLGAQSATSASRRNSPLSLAPKNSGAGERYGVGNGSAEAAVVKTVSPVGDSSDDEDLAPIKLSAEAREILGEDESQIGSSPRNGRASGDGVAGVGSGRKLESRNEYASGSGGGGGGGGIDVRESEAGRNGGGGEEGRPQMGRDGSFFYKKTGDMGLVHKPGYDAMTPAPRLRTVRINGSRSQTRSPPSSSPATQIQNQGGATSTLQDQNQNRSGGERSETVHEEDAGRHGLTTGQRTRRGEEYGVHSTMRAKRAGKMSGSFLNGPVRRGMIRRQSEDEEVHPLQSDGFSHGKSPGLKGHHDFSLSHDSPSRSPINRDGGSNPQVEALNSTSPSHHVAFASSAIVLPPNECGEIEHQKIHVPEPSTQPRQQNSANRHHGSNPSSRSSSARAQPIFKLPPLLPPPELPASHDQENEPPPTFKRSKPVPSVIGEVHRVNVFGEKDKDIKHGSVARGGTAAVRSPERKALAPRSQNTPHRVAPPAPAPPPKMSVLEAATSNAGSTRSKKKVAWSVNGKLFTRLDCIGRGGSSRVYRVMAENYKMFALKRVNLEEADAASIIGYKGEIDLLRRLENVERVVRLFDYEINDEKGELKVLMEMGESDFNRMLNLQIKSENARFDASFTRHYWREMLECVQAVHDQGIVHSDLKPANFLVVHGRLKIIDFGIANAIQDNTVNVHRENQIGTPNYMSPEALIDCNAGNGNGNGKRSGHGQQLLKLGKPSDVWSLGCILYQMTYGAPPFAHIANTHQRIMSIPNANVTIPFPNTTTLCGGDSRSNSSGGGIPLPTGLLSTLRACLSRDQSLRPTIPALLATTDPFLNPRDLGPDQVAIDQPMLGQVLQKVVHYCRANPDGLPGDGTLNEWAGTFLERIGRLDG